jgi:hypothetical protein
MQKSKATDSFLGGSSDYGFLGLGLLGSLLLLEVLREELLVGDVSLLTSLPSVLLDLLIDRLSSDSLFGNESLDVW